MNIEMMRFADYWLGRPLCFLFSAADFFSRLMPFRAKPRKTPRKILFIKLSELGAIILAYPLFRKIKRRYSGAELFFLTFENNKGIFNLLGGIAEDKNIVYIRQDSPLAFIQDTFRAIRRLRREEIDVVFDLDFFSRFTALLSYMVRAGKRAGFFGYTFEGLYRGSLMTHRVQYNPLSHISANYLSMAQAIEKEGMYSPELDEKGDSGELVFPQQASNASIREALRSRLKGPGIPGKSRLFLLNPGEGLLPLREWPLENFSSLCKMILSKDDDRIVIIGTGGALKKGTAILEALNNPRCVSLIGKTSLEELCGLFNIADALISNDCGLAHLAMLSSIKKFIIFGPESPQVFGPLGEHNHIVYSSWPCSPCLSALNHRKSACRDNKCLKAIKPEAVFGVITECLGNR